MFDFFSGSGNLGPEIKFDRTVKAVSIVEDQTLGSFEIIDQNGKRVLLKEVEGLINRHGLDESKIFSRARETYTKVLNLQGFTRRSKGDDGRSLVFEFARFSLKDIHENYRKTQRFIPENLIWKIFKDISRAGHELQTKNLWHSGISINNILIADDKGFKLSNPFMHDSFIKEYSRYSLEGIKPTLLEEQSNSNIKQLGLSLLAISSLAETDELTIGGDFDNDNVGKALKITRLVYSSDLYILIIYLLHGKNDENLLTFKNLRDGIIEGSKSMDQEQLSEVALIKAEKERVHSRKPATHGIMRDTVMRDSNIPEFQAPKKVEKKSIFNLDIFDSQPEQDPVKTSSKPRTNPKITHRQPQKQVYPSRVNLADSVGGKQRPRIFDDESFYQSYQQPKGFNESLQNIPRLEQPKREPPRNERISTNTQKFVKPPEFNRDDNFDVYGSNDNSKVMEQSLASLILNNTLMEDRKHQFQQYQVQEPRPSELYRGNDNYRDSMTYKPRFSEDSYPVTPNTKPDVVSTYGARPSNHTSPGLINAEPENPLIRPLKKLPYNKASEYERPSMNRNQTVINYGLELERQGRNQVYHSPPRPINFMENPTPKRNIEDRVDPFTNSVAQPKRKEYNPPSLSWIEREHQGGPRRGVSSQQSGSLWY